jgi:hypothetical protein
MPLLNRLLLVDDFVFRLTSDYYFSLIVYFTSLCLVVLHHVSMIFVLRTAFIHHVMPISLCVYSSQFYRSHSVSM